MSLNIASMGWGTELDEIHDIEFYGKESLASFDVVLLDPDTVSGYWEEEVDWTPGKGFVLRENRGSEREKYNFVKNTIYRRQSEFKEFLDSGGYLIIRLTKLSKLKLKRPRTKSDYSKNTYSFLPEVKLTQDDLFHRFPGSFKSSFLARGGLPNENLEINKKHPLAPYMEFVVDDSTPVELDYEIVLNRDAIEWGDFYEVIATNQNEHHVSVELPYQTGGIVFLPQISIPNFSAENGNLLDCLQGLFSNLSSRRTPGWANEFTVPGENKNAEEISDINDQIQSLEDEKTELEAEEEEIKKYKGLLYGKGDDFLEPIVRRSFDKLGFKVEEEIEELDEIDGCLKSTDLDQPTIIEVEGADDRAINLTKARQFREKVESANLKTEESSLKYSGLLVGNGFRETPPSERESNFTEDAIELCELRDFPCVATPQIYWIIEKILEENDEELKRQIHQRINEATGRIVFDDLLEEGEDS